MNRINLFISISIPVFLLIIYPYPTQSQLSLSIRMHQCAIAFFEFDNMNRDAADPGETDGQLAIWKPDIDPFCEVSKGPEAKCCIGDLEKYFPGSDKIFGEGGKIGSIASDGCTCFVFPTSNNCTGDWSFLMQGTSYTVPEPVDYMRDANNLRKNSNISTAKSILCYWDKDQNMERLPPNPPPVA
ncbi:hypothetical protein TWF569_005645 [Orbilia oligospora]|uniref:Uncharacterized protein n=2 Tax=Orbilia oligospora TaxID=2813651 RepID=A0A7C8NC66_ORBOL|nr:hypothetical protein TWF102_009498 [Orbilia oligospora]KAF3115861.1 hypothetical protein TWF706_005955 [Orbilia oligospora]KAF3118121.1 hypothetical protein TWF103_000152 [Orbilia oligospora]KAF3132681.1 hypothetical protein TWF594_009498 [Orbilia oligospora]KAF3156666.1 hypothetical protein TWF569_005645 [Orbilia oligospora]